tara:strand:- start:4803 stop:5021 length:219 start_codon:yes stop_codon:yes gene_type:complete
MADYEAYEINEADIDKVIAYLKTVDPEHATPEDGIAFLEYYQTVFHELSHTLSDEEMRKLYDEFAKKRGSEN